MRCLFLEEQNEIKNMNKGEVGAPFEYSHTYIKFRAFLKIDNNTKSVGLITKKPTIILDTGSR